VTIGHDVLMAVIQYEHCGFRMKHVSGSPRRKYCGNGKSESIFLNCEILIEVIGNIYDNPDLLSMIIPTFCWEKFNAP